MPSGLDAVVLRPIHCDVSDLLALHEADPRRYPHLLESAALGPNGRYDILFAFPGETLALSPRGGSDFLQALDAWWERERVHHDAAGPPFRGGWLVYLGYELAGQIEPRLRLPSAVGVLPVALATRFPAAVLRDRRAHGVTLLAERGREGLLDAMEHDLRALPEAAASAAAVAAGMALREDPPERFLHGVQRILRYIRDGDVFQVNLSRTWHGRVPPGLGTAWLYRRLRQSNPAPFAALVSFRDAAIVSSSPERLVRVRGDRIETRPIAGTHPRSTEAAGDAALKAALLAHPKERAEHIMLIDLKRNDLGRVCRPGTVEVDELLTVESYAHVHHIVSNVRGRLAARVSPGQALRALFPGGTITGCPKVRCMEIIAELERAPRGPYTGAVGYINRDGDMDFSILIRTLVKEGSTVTLRAGAGIVADSLPERELEETRAKAKGLLLALGS